MDLQQRCELLQRLYRIHDGFISGIRRACREHCAACCTCNVTGTTLEGWWLLEQLRGAGTDLAAFAQKLSSMARPQRFNPQTTINEMAGLCVQGRELPEEHNDPAAGSCPMLEGDLCPIYEIRPFGCRAMLSTQDCTGAEEARMPPLVLSANHVVMQYIEALDRPGASGNMIDILLFLSDPARRRAYENRMRHQWPRPLRPNRPIPALLIPPEHRKAVQPLLETLSMCSR